MLDIKQIVEDAVNEKQGRVSKDPNHARNVEFIKNYYGKEIRQSNYSNYISSTKSKFLRAIEQHDKELLKKLEDDSLDSLKKLIDDYNVPIAKPIRKSEWKQAEKDIANGLNALFKSNFFVYIGKDGQEHAIDSRRFVAKTAGGGQQSDICVENTAKHKQVYIESKLDFATSEYFKFGLVVQNGKLKYDHSYHLRNLSSEDKEKMDMLFSKDLDISGFLNDIVHKPDIVDYWNQFLANIESVQKMLAEDEEFKEFAGKVNMSKSFPENVDALVDVFDTYVKYYEEKYNSLGWQIYETLEQNGLDDPEDYFMIGDGSERSVSNTFGGVNYFLDSIYAWQEMKDAMEDIKLQLDEKKMLALADEMKTIEAKVFRILDKTRTNRPKELLELSATEKLRYFFAAFLSSTGRKVKGKHQIVDMQQDVLGNMVVCPQTDVESPRLAQMVCDYYLKKDHCAYIQIADTIYALAEDYNLFAIPDVPCFKNCMTTFTVGLLVSDDMSKVSLHIKAHQPNEQVMNGSKRWSFKQKDPNFLGKKLKGIQIH